MHYLCICFNCYELMYIIKQINRRTLLSCLCITFFSGLTYAENNNFSFKFADKRQADNVLTVSDKYIESLGKFDLEARVGNKGATRKDLLNKIEQSTGNFTKEEKDSIIKAFDVLSDNIERKRIKLPIPKELLLIKTTMEEEGGAAAYTRGDVICIGEGFLKRIDTKRLAKLLAHELFHVLTRDNKEFRKSMYEIIGFKILNKEIKFADDIKDRFISNPDVNSYDNYAMFTVDGKAMPCTMIIRSDKDYAGGSFFDYVHIGLVPLDNNFNPMMKDHKTIVYDLDDASDFYDKVGRNTGYVINPEECLADNFSLALCGSEKELPNPEIIEKIVNTIQKMYVN